MIFNLSIINKNTKGKRTIDVSKIKISDIPCIQEDDIWEYNDMFSEIVSQKEKFIEYLISPTLTRIEGSTLFFDKICRFVYCLESIKESKENIVFINLDYKLSKALIDYAAQNNLKARYNSSYLFWFNLFKWLKFIRDAIRIIFINAFSIIGSRFFIKMPTELSYDYAFYSFYDYRSFKEGKHRDEYFDPFLKWLINKGKRIIIFNQILHHNRINLILKHLSQISNPCPKYENTVNYRFLGLKDLFSSIFFGFWKKPRIDKAIFFKGHDLSYLTKVSLQEDFLGLSWLKAYLDYFFAKDILKRFSIHKIFYPYENHPWEKAFILARNRAFSSTQLIAFQHSSVSYKLLQYFPGKYEEGLSFFPDKILTGGRILKNVLETKGHYASGLIEEGCGLRYRHLFEEQLIGSRRHNRFKKAAYAFSFDFKNYEIVLSYLEKIFDNNDYTVYLKFHPDFVRNIDFKHRLPKNFIDARDISWEEIFREIDLLLYDDNTLCIEALKYNVDVGYFALTGQMYNTDRLFEYKQNKIVVSSVESFKVYLKKYYQKESADGIDGIQRYNKDYINNYFSAVDDERFASFL